MPVDLDRVEANRVTRRPGYGRTQVCITEEDFRAMAAELRTLRARVAEMERDARLGANVRGVIATGGVGSGTPEQLDGYAQSLADDRSMFGAAVITAIADALRAEEGGE